MELVIALGTGAFTDINDAELIRKTISLKALPLFFPEQDEIAGLRGCGREIKGDAPVGIIQGTAVKAPEKEEGLFPHPLDNAAHKGPKGPSGGKSGLNHVVDE